jgi:predicted RNA-binding Zn-ribbon protein involved in translation (DUF1610 family)
VTKLTVIEGGKVEEVEIPERVDFACPQCGSACVMYPRNKPMAVQHSLPTCKLWDRVQGKKEDVERFLVKAGVHVLVPKGEA